MLSVPSSRLGLGLGLGPAPMPGSVLPFSVARQAHQERCQQEGEAIESQQLRIACGRPERLYAGWIVAAERAYPSSRGLPEGASIHMEGPHRVGQGREILIVEPAISQPVDQSRYSLPALIQELGVRLMKPIAHVEDTCDGENDLISQERRRIRLLQRPSLHL